MAQAVTLRRLGACGHNGACERPAGGPHEPPKRAHGTVGQPTARLGRITAIRIHGAGAPAGGRTGVAPTQGRGGERRDASHGDPPPRGWTGGGGGPAPAGPPLLVPP